MKMRKSTHLWREEDHPRDDWGRFCKSNHLGEKIVDNTYEMVNNHYIGVQMRTFTKVKVEDIPSMNEKLFDRIKSNLAKRGVVIIQDADGDRYLQAMGAEAITLSDGLGIIFQSDRVPSASACFEEIIHVTQIRLKGRLVAIGDKSATVEYYNREVEANEKMLRYKKQYKLTEKDIESIQKNLAVYYEKLKEIEGSV